MKNSSVQLSGATFQVEAEEHLHAISTLLLELEKLSSAPQRTPSSAPGKCLPRGPQPQGRRPPAVDLMEIESIMPGP